MTSTVREREREGKGKTEESKQATGRDKERTRKQTQFWKSEAPAGVCSLEAQKKEFPCPVPCVPSPPPLTPTKHNPRQWPRPHSQCQSSLVSFSSSAHPTSRKDTQSIHFRAIWITQNTIPASRSLITPEYTLWIKKYSEVHGHFLMWYVYHSSINFSWCDVGRLEVLNFSNPKNKIHFCIHFYFVFCCDLFFVYLFLFLKQGPI